MSDDLRMALISAIVGAVIGGGLALLGGLVTVILATIATSLQNRHDARQTIRLATAERLHQTYGEMLAAAWIQDDATNSGSWNEQQLEDWQKPILRIGDVARARLSLEDSFEVNEIDKRYREIRGDYFRWRMHQATSNSLKAKEKLSDGEHDDLGKTNNEMRSLDGTIRAKVNELESLCKEHVAKLRYPISPWWQVWKSRLDR